MVMVIYLAGLATVPTEIEEAAALDGASTWRRFRHITVPSIRPSIAIASTLMLIQGLRVFDQVLALTGGGPAGATETLATPGLQGDVRAQQLRLRRRPGARAHPHHPRLLGAAAGGHQGPFLRSHGPHVPVHEGDGAARGARLDLRADLAAALLLPRHHRAEARRGAADHGHLRAAEPPHRRELHRGTEWGRRLQHPARACSTARSSRSGALPGSWPSGPSRPTCSPAPPRAGETSPTTCS